MAHEGDFETEDRVMVEFEPAARWPHGEQRGEGPPTHREALRSAFYDALHFAVRKGGDRHSRCGVFKPGRDDTHLRMVVPESLVEELRAQPFVARDAADGTKSTLKILPPR